MPRKAERCADCRELSLPIVFSFVVEAPFLLRGCQEPTLTSESRHADASGQPIRPSSPVSSARCAAANPRRSGRSFLHVIFGRRRVVQRSVRFGCLFI